MFDFWFLIGFRLVIDDVRSSIGDWRLPEKDTSHQEDR